MTEEYTERIHAFIEGTEQLCYAFVPLKLHTLSRNIQVVLFYTVTPLSPIQQLKNYNW